eukprot:gene17279-4225_t
MVRSSSGGYHRVKHNELLGGACVGKKRGRQGLDEAKEALAPGLAFVLMGPRVGAAPRVFPHGLTCGRYRVTCKLGWGQFSTVWLCREEKTEQMRAVKVSKAAPGRA